MDIDWGRYESVWSERRYGWRQDREKIRITDHHAYGIKKSVDIEEDYQSKTQGPGGRTNRNQRS